MQAVEEGGGGEERNARFEENDLDLEISKLRGRWELASVLNFLDVFGPILGKDLNLSAEDIEIGLVKPDASLARLHIQLLKGIPPVSKTLEDSDKWVTALCKNLATWWPWVAEGEIPLVPSKGVEISKYKELDPLDRLLLLKALCEVRAQQHDAVSYINDALKEGTQISTFRKDAVGRDGTGTSYWYDATSKGQSHRLYREIITSDSIPNDKDEECLSLPTIQWETLASNLEDFSKVAEKFAISKSAVEVAVSMKLQDDAIPALEKLRKKKERAIKQKQRQDMLLKKDFQNSHYSGNTRSCRTRRPISYTFVENHGSSEEDGVDGELGNLEAPSSHAVSYPKGVRCSKRLAGVPSHTILESRGLTAKQRLRQRPTRNSAMESINVSDSEDEAREGKRDLSEST
ncbi:hypothetical protein AAZX31_04G071600 [Glycine max]|uniref:DDT domain-containing protein DDR4 n=1 Tax=Glycine soja TaxID=3848 RepID=A0A445KXA9_GLYSO|nr:DDT domain-containing protein DDR4-like [Glycine soja]KAG5048482.1 hypothetical protein JHK85_009585 [Glycine max]KAG5065596.1 hypothetical protein JHK86_009327 [Glycine max]KAH1110252.1 hypothetical protein GYH30_009227 [Glycine max]KAH1252926.1 DDT domain-containing protein DDR4 [Glycine max]KHN10284.1 Remodeling and spacing factor 1 [Glycine soja]